jgi:aminopeptidase N
VQEDFEKTPKMSTYLSAFHISNLKKADHENGEIDIDQPTINIWARKDVLDMTNYAHRLTKKLLPYLESYFNIKYKLPKIDMIAVPDFGFSGMENWGMITFR